MGRLNETLQSIIEPVVTGMGYELVGIEYLPAGKHSLLRIYIDHEEGISVDDCGDVSHQVSGVLDVEDPISSNYTLEVSSPGLDRPLFSVDHYQRFVGREVKLMLHAPLDGRRKFKGLIVGVTEDDQVLIRVDGEEFLLPLSNISKANLVPDF